MLTRHSTNFLLIYTAEKRGINYEQSHSEKSLIEVNICQIPFQLGPVAFNKSSIE